MLRNRFIATAAAKLEKLAHRSAFFSELYARPYRSVVQGEVDLAGIRSDDCVLNVGCGAIPFTAIHVARLTDASVLAMDRDPSAVMAARQCLERLGLDKMISLIIGDAGREVPPGFTVALVALQAEPKAEIFEQLTRRCGGGARFVFRMPSDRFVGQYDSLKGTPRPDAFTRQNMQTFDRSELFLCGSPAAGSCEVYENVL